MKAKRIKKLTPEEIKKGEQFEAKWQEAWSKYGGKPSKWDVLHSSAKGDWGTPQALFDGLNRRFGPFDLDAAATLNNKKCKFFLTDALRADSWSSKPGEGNATTENVKRVWLNPPYGRGIGKWLSKAASEARKAADEAEKGCRVVCLVPARTGSRWFVDAAKRASEILFIVGRITFDGAPSPAPFDSAVIVFDQSNEALREQPEYGGPRVSWISREELYK